MPITLPPIDRRRFLQGTLGLVASPLFGPALRAEDSSSRRDTWAFLSDTHIPGDRNKTNGKPPVNPVGHLSKVRADILSGEAGRPDGVIVCGDCAFLQGKPDDYVTILEEFKPVREAGLPVHFVMGNHDNRRAFLETVAGQATPESIPDRLHSIVETPKANFFLLDSLETTNRTPGLLGGKQLDWLAGELDARKDKPAILVAHHYPDYTNGVVANPHALVDTEAFYDVIMERKQVKAYFYGHAHVWKRFRKNGVHLVNFPTTAWRFDRTQPCGWVLVRLRDDGITLRLRSIEPDHPKHDETIELQWRT